MRGSRHPARMALRTAAMTILALSTLLAASPASPVSAANAASPVSVTSATSPGASVRDPGWAWPVDGARIVDRPFVAPAEPWSPGHRGVDLSAPGAAAAVRAAMGGVVHFAGVVVDRPVITVRDGQLLVTVEPVEPIVVEGQRVEAGEVIGTLLPGHCGGSGARVCVHLGVRLAGEYVSPLLYLGGLQRAVLLPLAEG